MPETTAIAPISGPIDLSPVLAHIEILFMELATLDLAFGTNYGADKGRSAKFEGWHHPQLIKWAAEREKTDPRYELAPAELYVLEKSLERKLAALKGECDG